MIYLDTSVALACVLAEDRRPPDSLWQNSLVSSRLLEYELWTPLHTRGLTDSHGDVAHQLLGRIAFLEMTPLVLARALEPFPAVSVPLRTLDALHLASCMYLMNNYLPVSLASYDRRMSAAARAMEIPLLDLNSI